MSRDYQLLNPQITDAAGNVLFQLRARPTGSTLTFDASWAPYVQGTIACAPPSAAELTKLDPRLGVRLQATLRQVDLDTGKATDQPLNLGVRSRPRTYSKDPQGEEVRISVASDEALCQDYQQGDPFSTGTSDAITLATYALNLVQNNQKISTWTVESGAPNANIATDGTLWDTGTSAWDYMSGVSESVGAWLYCDEVRGWHYALPTFAAVTATQKMSDQDHIISVTDDVSRDNPAWGNYAVVAYLKNSPTAYVVSDAGLYPRKTYSVSKNLKKPGSNAATRVRQNAQRRGRTLQLSALSELTARPNQTWQVQYQGVTWTGVVQSVSFDIGAGLMSMSLNVIES